MAPNCTVFNSGCVVAEIETVPAVTFTQRKGERDSEKDRRRAACSPFTCFGKTKDLGNELDSLILHISVWKVLHAANKVTLLKVLYLSA